MKENNAVEQPVETAQEELKNTSDVPAEETVTISKIQAEELVKMAEDATKLAQKKTEDAENYKKGMLKYKSKLEENGIEEEEAQPAYNTTEIANLIRETVKEAVKDIVPQQPAQDELAKANEKIQELRNTIINKPSIAVSTGSNLDKPEVKSSNYWSEAQLEEIKLRFPNLNPDDVLKNIPKPGQPGAPLM